MAKPRYQGTPVSLCRHERTRRDPWRWRSLPTINNEHTTSLGAFSVSLTVKDIQASKRFCAELGFEKVGGNQDENWLILRNGSATIGLFQGMFEHNILTFNPGWDAQSNELEQFAEVRELERRFRSQGITLEDEAEVATTGPASFTLVDPDGNRIRRRGAMRSR